jgi:glycosyltransferase involved in cell wall biosynthesis
MPLNKHILFIVENQTVPQDVRVWSEAKAAQEMGLEVSVVCPLNEKYPKSYEVIKGIHIYRHPSHADGHGMMHYLREYLSAFLWELWLTLKICVRKPIGVIHAANPPDNIFLLGAMLKPFGTRFIFDHHDLSPELFRVRLANDNAILNRILLLFEKFSCKLSNVIISTNNSYRRIVIDRHNIDPEKVFIVRNDPGIPPCSTVDKVLSHDTRQERRTMNLLYLGSINPQDGVEVLMHGLHHLVYQLGENRFLCKVVGDGSSLKQVREVAHQLGILSNVEFTGFIYDKEEVRRLLQNADICIESAPLNVVNTHSTFIKVMEYMSAGKPLVAFDLTETRYSAGGAALLVPPGDIAAFAEAIQRLIRNPSLRRIKGQAGLHRIQSRLNWDFSKINLSLAYQKVGIVPASRGSKMT